MDNLTEIPSVEDARSGVFAAVNTLVSAVQHEERTMTLALHLLCSHKQMRADEQRPALGDEEQEALGSAWHEWEVERDDLLSAAGLD